MDKNQKIKNKKEKKEFLSEEERKKAYMSLNHECFFEYDMVHDIFSISRNSMFSGMNGIKITNGSEKIRRLERIYEEDLENFIDYFITGAKEKIEFRYIKEDGTCIWCMAKGAVIRDDAGKPKALIGSIADIDQERRMHEMLVEQALLDPLTKLYSRTKAQSLIESFLRNEGSFGKHALLIINIRSFNEINKRLGNVFGDGILINISEKIQQTFRKKDIVARIGGDDFMVLLKDVPNQDAIERKTRLLLSEIHEMYVGENVSIFCDIGVSCFPKDGRNFGGLFRNADCALYKASKIGENGCEIYDPSYKLDEYNKRGEFYHEYVIKEYNKNSSCDFSREITDFAVDIMLNSKDVASAIKLLLDKIGKYYKCDSVYILETDDNQILHTTYSWNGKDGLNHYNAMQFVDLREMPPMDTYFDERNIRIISNTSIMKHHPGYSSFIGMLDCKALLQSAFFEEGEFRGCICVGYAKKTHEWLKEEINALITITKLISVYLLKLKTSEKIQNKIERLANYDTLTALPTLHKFCHDVKEVLKKNQHTQYAIVHMDINKFKYINDTLGYDAGDDLVREIANTVSTEAFDIVLMGRVAADNFVLLMTYVNEEQIIKNLQQINASFQNKIKFCGIGKSIYIISGVALLKYGQDVMSVIDNANVARKSIKKKAETTCCFYGTKLEEQMLLEMDICNSMQQALDDGEFLMYLQPKVRLSDKVIVGAEALTRWRRKDGTIMAPDKFIPLFENNGFIVSLDFYIYECACKVIQKWIEQDIIPVAISVNVSRVHLNSDDFVEKLLALINKYNIPHEYLELELTESIFLDNTEIALSTMKKLHEEGFCVSIDDFGAGYSSLNLLKDMATDVIKLDKEFFSKGNMMKNEEKIIVSSITNMAKQLKMKVLSEGVETEAQSEFLKDISCDMAQGYFFAKPMPEPEFTKLLRATPPKCSIMESQEKTVSSETGNIHNPKETEKRKLNTEKKRRKKIKRHKQKI